MGGFETGGLFPIFLLERFLCWANGDFSVIQLKVYFALAVRQIKEMERTQKKIAKYMRKKGEHVVREHVVRCCRRVSSLT